MEVMIFIIFFSLVFITTFALWKYVRLKHTLTLENFFYTWNNYDELPAIPEILVRDGQIILEKTV